jgi:PAS domain S-box-containing protein
MDGTVTFWNAAAERLYGYSSAEAMGGNLLKLIIRQTCEDVAAAMQHMAQTGEAVPASEMLLQTKAETVFPSFPAMPCSNPWPAPNCFA